MKMDEKVFNAGEYMRDQHINGKEWIRPTDVGFAVGGAFKHSSYGSPICMEMVKRGLAERNDKGHYRLIKK